MGSPTTLAFADVAPALKIRTVTTFIQLRPGDEAQWAKEINFAVEANRAVRARLEAAGYEVQTVRIATNPFGEFLNIRAGASAVEQQCLRIDELLTQAGATPGRFGLLSLGPARSLEEVAQVPTIVRSSGRFFCSADLTCAGDHPDREMAEAVGAAVREVADATAGEGCFQFCMTAGMPPLGPFFPASFAQPLAEGQPATSRCCALGLQYPDLVVDCFTAARGCARQASELLRARCLEAIGAVQATVLECGEAGGCLALDELGPESNLRYAGIDVSVAPFPESQSLVKGFEALLPPGSKFGQGGSLAICALLTRVLHRLRDGEELRTTGYCGLMLPPLEDTGLAERSAEGLLGLPQLMQYSAVCGLGLDTVPVPGDASPQQLAAVYEDVAVLAARLNKPLSARIFPVPGKAAGERCTFDNPNLCDGAVMMV